MCIKNQPQQNDKKIMSQSQKNAINVNKNY